MNEPIDTELLDETVKLINDKNWSPIKSELVRRVIECMPSAVLDEIANADESDKRTKEKIVTKVLYDFYDSIENPRHELVETCFDLIGSQQTLYYLNLLELPED
mgnify:CR=1 FL=1|tara:strand:+ start:98 stop:409 length:312 start_codon:yes stop_codon:yes gene_type:complete